MTSSQHRKILWDSGNKVLLVGAILFFLYHLLTLAISPLPWFDETFFASMTASFNSTGELNLLAAPFAYDGEMLLYGPVYFWITSLFTQILGLDIVSFRLPGVIFGFLSILVFYKVARLFLPKQITCLAVVALSFDPLFNANMHSGRMDMVALFFALASIFIYQKHVSDMKGSLFGPFLISGIIFAVALLTTPRIGILLIAFVVCQLSAISQKSIARLLQLTVFAGSIGITYIAWILFSFGSFSGFLQYYLGFLEYLGGGYYSYPVQQLPLTVIMVVSSIVGITLDFKRFLSPLVQLSLTSVALFYSVVYDTGQYSVIIIPFKYAIIGSAVMILYDKVHSVNKAYSVILRSNFLGIILLGNVLLFTMKVITIYISSETRNPVYISSFVKRNIPPQSRVIGDESHFYAVTKASSEFQYIHLFKKDLEREEYQRNVYNYDYIIWSDRLQRDYPALLDVYKRKSKIIEVAEFKNNKNKKLAFAERALKSLNVPVDITYNCVIYKRLK